MDEPGPSTNSRPRPPTTTEQSSNSFMSSKAKWHPLPRTTFRSIEYPGPVSRPSAILKVVTQADVDECFNANTGDARQLEMRYRPEERSAVPVRGSRVASQKVLVKIVKRRRRRTAGDTAGQQGVFTAQITGSIPQTVRFRSMADFQYTPPQQGHVANLTQALLDLDYDAILDYRIPNLNEEFFERKLPGEEGAFAFRSLLELQPTPVASVRQLPNVFNFKMNTQTVQEKVWDDDAKEHKTRFVNKSRVSGYSVPVVGHAHPVPMEPEKELRDRIPKLDERIWKRLQELMEERPVWQRYGLLAHFNEADRYEIESNKVYLPALGFTYGAGPFWKTIVRYGYDPCADKEAYRYQRVYVYLDVKRTKNNVLNTKDADEEEEQEEAKRPSFWWENEQNRLIAEGFRPPIDPARVHIYDGEVIHRNKPDYQFMDIHDPVLYNVIHDPAGLKDVCDSHSGWYRPITFELIKALLRVRYAHLRDRNEPAREEATLPLIEAYERALVEGEDGEAGEAFNKQLAVSRRVMR